MSNRGSRLDVESAYGSDASTLRFTSKNEKFEIEESTTKTELWYQWLINRCREYMILEALVFVILLFNTFKLYHISKHHNHTYEMISKRLDGMERTLGNTGNYRPLTEDIINSAETKKFDETVEEILRLLRKKTVETSATTHTDFEPPPNFEISEKEDSKTVNQVDHLIEEKEVMIAENEQPNALIFYWGATVDTSHSSSSSLNPIIGFDQSSLVLVNRPKPPANKGWCSNTENPVLTINLAKFIKPTSVSYQHSKWNGIVPDGAPKLYDVVSCLDFYCEKWEPLVSNCAYSYGFGIDRQEQICKIPSIRNISSVGKVQFRFRENHGDTEKTCVYLVRVYGETKDAPKIKERTLEDEEKCTSLRWHHQNFKLGYTLMFKNCTILYRSECCTECSECCDDCVIQDFNISTIGYGFLYLFVLLLSSPVLAIILAIPFFLIWACFEFLWKHCCPCIR